MRECDPLERLNAMLLETNGVYVDAGVDEATYFEGLRASIKEHLCTPFHVSAVVTEPGFPDLAVGASVAGWCMAHSAGYWLVYQPGRDRFLCFWGTHVDALGAPGIFGCPLYCWSA